MDFNMILEAISTQGIWCLLFVYLFYETRKESANRETKLQGIITEQGIQLKEIAETLEAINAKITRVEDELHDLEETA